MEAVRSGNTTRAAELWWETPLMAGVAAVDGKERYRQIVMDNARIWTLSRANERPLSSPAIDRLKEIEAPTLIVIGERDLPATHQAADALIAGIKQARLARIPDSGHMVTIERPAAFNNLMLEFLSTP